MTRTEQDAPRTEARQRPGPVRRVLTWLLTVLLVILCVVLVVTVAYPRVRGYVPLTILSGSMDPTYPAGSQVFVEPVEGSEEAGEKVDVGSVVTFMPNPDDPTLVTHRVVKVSYDTQGEPSYTTQGDANNTPDEATVGPTQLRGVVRYHVPYVGHVASSMDDGRKDALGAALAGGLFVYALWNVVVAVRERRHGDEEGGAGAD